MSERSATPSSPRVIGLVAKREFTTRLLTRAYLISTAVILVVVVLGQVIFSVVSGGDDPAKVVVTGQSVGLSKALLQAGEDLDEPVDVIRLDSRATADRKLKSGDVDLLVYATDDTSFTVRSRDDIDGALAAVVNAATHQLVLDRALTSRGVDPDALAADVAKASVHVDVLEPSGPDKAERMVLAYVAVFLLFFSVYLYGIYVAMGVVEEKSSRVVELLLSTIRPLDLLVGKVLGIGAVGLVQLVLVGGTALVTALATGLVTVGGTAVAVYVFSVIWYVLGFVFFAVLYAALGSLVSRQEDVNAATMPLNLLAFAMFFVAQSALSDPEAPWIEVLSWIPPFSSTLMPMRIAAGVTEPVQIAGTIVIMGVATAVAAVFAARIYHDSVLNTGGRRSLRQALGRTAG